jgi:hypothetical protein
MVQEHYEGRSFPKKRMLWVRMYRVLPRSNLHFSLPSLDLASLRNKREFLVLLSARNSSNHLYNWIRHIHKPAMFVLKSSFFLLLLFSQKKVLACDYLNNSFRFAFRRADSWTESYDAEMIMNSSIDNTTLQKHQHVQIQMLRNQDVLQTSNGRWMIAMAYGAEIVLVGAISLTLF